MQVSVVGQYQLMIGNRGFGAVPGYGQQEPRRNYTPPTPEAKLNLLASKLTLINKQIAELEVAKAGIVTEMEEVKATIPAPAPVEKVLVKKKKDGDNNNG